MPLPKPRTGESQNDFISRCMGNEEIKRDFGSGSKQAQAVCFSQFKKNKQMSQIKLNYQVPIKIVELSSQGETGVTDFLIQGIAINSTLTDNKHKFLGEELEKASNTLNDVPLLKDHENMVDSIVGRVVHSEFNSVEENILFRARINNTESGKHIKELIKSGDLNTVSIGANVERLDEEDGVFIPRGIIFKELSLVAVPADDDAKFSFKGGDFQLALKEAYKTINQKSYSSFDESNLVTENKLNKKEKQMKEDNKSKLTEQEEEVKEPEKEEETKEEEKEDSEVKTEVEALSKSVKAQSNLIAQLISEMKIKSADVDEEKPEKESEAPAEEEKSEPEPKTETKEAETESEEKADEETEEEEEVNVDEKSGFKIVRSYNSFTVLRNKY